MSIMPLNEEGWMGIGKGEREVRGMCAMEDKPHTRLNVMFEHFLTQRYYVPEAAKVGSSHWAGTHFRMDIGLDSLD